jgi:hypothetical protein
MEKAQVAEEERDALRERVRELEAEVLATKRESLWITLDSKNLLHPWTKNLVVRFARALAKKLSDAEQKYGYEAEWKDPNWMDECRAKLIEHLAKGDPRDVAAYCAFLWYHKERTAAPPKQPEAQAAP